MEVEDFYLADIEPDFVNPADMRTRVRIRITRWVYIKVRGEDVPDEIQIGLVKIKKILVKRPHKISSPFCWQQPILHFLANFKPENKDIHREKFFLRYPPIAHKNFNLVPH